MGTTQISSIRTTSPLIISGGTLNITRLAEFNERENLLSDPFRVRQGIHTGKSLVDRVHGVAYSPLLDVAGHLQKHSPANGLLVSEQTLAELPEGLPFVAAIRREKDDVQSHRLEGVVD